MPQSRLLKTATDQAWDSLSKSDRLIAEHLTSYYPDTAFSSVTEIAKALGISKATVGRFFRKLGFSSFSDFRQQIREEMNQYLISSPMDRLTQSRGRKYSLDDLAKQENENITRTLKEVDQSQLSAFVRNLCKPDGTVFICGERKNWPLAFLLYVQLHWILPSVRPIYSTGGFMADHLLDIGPEDTLIIFYFRRYPRLIQQFVSALRYRNNWNGLVALVTDSPQCPLSSLANYRFIIETEGLSLFDSYSAAVSLINAILLEVVEQNPELATERSARVEFLSDMFNLYHK